MPPAIFWFRNKLCRTVRWLGKSGNELVKLTKQMAVTQKVLFTAQWPQFGEEVSDWNPAYWCSQWPPSSLTEEGTLLFTRISLGSFRKSLLALGTNKSTMDISQAKLSVPWGHKLPVTSMKKCRDLTAYDLGWFYWGSSWWHRHVYVKTLKTLYCLVQGNCLSMVATIKNKCLFSVFWVSGSVWRALHTISLNPHI